MTSTEYVEYIVSTSRCMIGQLRPGHRLTYEGGMYRGWMPVAEWDTKVDGPAPDERRTWATTPSEQPVAGRSDPDIGMCDLCGSEEGRRRQMVLDRTPPTAAWVCGECRALERTA
jgi:hypothetical protein